MFGVYFNQFLHCISLGMTENEDIYLFKLFPENYNIYSTLSFIAGDLDGLLIVFIFGFLIGHYVFKNKLKFDESKFNLVLLFFVSPLFYYTIFTSSMILVLSILKSSKKPKFIFLLCIIFIRIVSGFFLMYL